ncbi:hypothetical protein D3C71_451790 [compost metagenome]
MPSPLTLLVSTAVLFGCALLAFALYTGFKKKANRGFNVLLACVLGIAAMSASIATGAMTDAEEVRGGETSLAERTVQEAYFDVTDRAERYLRQAVSQHFDKICTFNGYLIEGEWLRSDLHPCIERGNVRIWRLEEENGSLIHYAVGRINGDGTVTTAIDYRPNNPTRVFAETPSSQDIPKSQEADVKLIAPVVELLAAEFPTPTETASFH